MIIKETNYLALFAKSFNWAGFFLPKDTYEECSKLYAFCRVLDDVADANQDLEIKKERFNELKEIFNSVSITTSSIAYDPFNKLSDIPNSPKERYKIMTAEMPKGGRLSLDMMYKTAGIQINYDYISEDDFEKKFKIGNYLAPLTIALFANSPFTENKLSGFLSYRSKVWQETNRGGIMPITFESVNFEKYVDNVINYPILFLKKNKRYYSPNGQTFNDYLNGNLNFLKGQKPTFEDFENHLGTIFTEVRLKQVIEFRSLDTCNFGCICNGPSFFTGLIYGSIDETYEIIKNWRKEEVMQAYLNAPKLGLNATLEGKKLIDWARIFFDLSKKGLEKRNEVNKSGKNETIYLKHIEEIIESKKTRAEMLIEQFNKTKNLNFLVNHDENFSYTGF